MLDSFAEPIYGSRQQLAIPFSVNDAEAMPSIKFRMTAVARIAKDDVFARF